MKRSEIRGLLRCSTQPGLRCASSGLCLLILQGADTTLSVYIGLNPLPVQRLAFLFFLPPRPEILDRVEQPGPGDSSSF